MFNIAGQSLRFYCENCETGICSSCTDIEHRDHITIRMSEAVEKEKAELQDLIEKSQNQVSTGLFKVRRKKLLFLTTLKSRSHWNCVPYTSDLTIFYDGTDFVITALN